MFSVMIVEDEGHILKYMQKKLTTFDEFQVIGAFATPEEALAAFDGIQPEVVFLDIEMPRMNGIELARRLLDRKPDLHIIFTTAYGQYAVNAFEVEALDYLMKPIVDDDIARVIRRLKKAAKGSQPHKDGGAGTMLFPVRCFGCFEVRDHQQQVVGWPTRKAEELFAYFLVHQGRPISKWELLELLWNDMAEERGLNNLYNTIYRIKQVLKKLTTPATIKNINDAYVLESEQVLSDLGYLLLLLEKENNDPVLPVEEIVVLVFSYTTPLFGMRDYLWSLSIQEYVAGLYRTLCRRLLGYYREQDQFQPAEALVRHYVTQVVVDETMMGEWLDILGKWSGHEKKVIHYRRWFHEKLKQEELRSQ